MAQTEQLGVATRAAGLELAPRLAVYRNIWAGGGSTRRCFPFALRRADGEGLAHEDRWAAGARAPIPFVPQDALRRHARRARRGRARAALLRPRAGGTARLRGRRPPSTKVCGDDVTHVVTRNVNFTNVCYFRCGFCAFSKGKLAEDLRGKPYLVPVEEIARRAERGRAAASRSASRAGITPAFTGDTYREICEA